MSIDVIIPCGPNDEDIIQRTISSALKYVVDVRRIYVIAHKVMDLSNAIVIPETSFPFTKLQVAEKTSERRAGWYLQQLLKFYAPLLLTGCSKSVLWLDADTVFNNRVRFMEQGKYLMNMTRETHIPYYDHMLRLHPSFHVWKKLMSGITNCMIVNADILAELMAKVEGQHEGREFWEIFLEAVTEKMNSGASEYEIYFHYIMNTHPEKVRLRPLRWHNFGQRTEKEIRGDWDYVSFHSYNQRKVPLFSR
jgi:Family of unknown function (DUF6492)